jgi:osmoprotectant transport system permease protein
LLSGFVALSAHNAFIVLALAIFAAAPLLTNTVSGMLNVDADTLEVARGLGMRPAQVLVKVELPLALPSIAAGVRTSIVQVIATTTLAVYAGGPGLGYFIDQPVNQFHGEVVGGAILVALLALIAELGLGQLQTMITPGPRVRRRGIRTRLVTIGQRSAV